MTGEERERRDSRALEPELITDPQAKAAAGAILPGTPTIPDQIVDNRNPYFEALDAADAAYRDGKIDVSKMETLLAALLAKQLAGFYQAAGGKLPE
jgi:hypothetical protein